MAGHQKCGRTGTARRLSPSQRVLGKAVANARRMRCLHGGRKDRLRPPNSTEPRNSPTIFLSGCRPRRFESARVLSQQAAHDRAVRYAVETGEMADMHLIHSVQRFEGNQPCFGRAESACNRCDCRWFEHCMALVTYTPPTQTPCQPRRPERKRKSPIRIPPIARPPSAQSTLRGLPRHYEDTNPSHSARAIGASRN